MSRKVVSFLVSGRGSNFTAVAQKILSGEINAKLGIVISDKKEAKALEIAREFSMGAHWIDPKAYTSREEHERAMVSLLKKNKTDLIVAAGYMRLLTPYFVKAYKNAIINIHPALLPSFPGVDGQRQAYEYGVKITGCTVHFIDEGTDSGPIIMQAAVDVRQNETLEELSARILQEEHRILSASVRLFCENRLKVMGRRVFIK